MSALVAQQTGLVFNGPVGSLDSYISRVSQAPVLTKDDEVALAKRFREEGDLGAARHLVFSHLRFVVHMARRYLGYGLPFGDLIQEGNLGLMKAVKRFDPGMGVRLVSFAVHWIRAEIHGYVLRNWRLVNVATTKTQRKLFFNLRKMKKSLAWLSEQETQAIAKDLGVDASEVREMELRLSGRDLPFDASPDHDDDEGFSPAVYLPAKDADPADELERDGWQEDAATRLKFALEQLDDRSRSILKRRYMAEDKATLHELAAEYGISAERVRQVENAAIRRLKGLMAS